MSVYVIDCLFLSVHEYLCVLVYAYTYIHIFMVIIVYVSVIVYKYPIGTCRNTKEDKHVLDTNQRRRMIRGYSGFIPEGKTISGRPIIPSDEKQEQNINEMTIGRTSRTQSNQYNSNNIDDRRDSEVDDYSSFREVAKHMDILERYAEATSQLLKRGQSPEMLLKLVQAKISERVQNYANQLITVKLQFQSFGVDVNDGLNESGLRDCLEKINIQLDDVQLLSLFSYFDLKGSG